jgi:hypothetical protein
MVVLTQRGLLMRTDREVRLREKTAEKPQKAPFTAPRLTIHGTVEKITQQLGPVKTDGQQGSLPL